jgi:hypothetical protein
LGNDGIDSTPDPQAGQRSVDNQRQALAGDVVDHDEHPEATTVGQHIGA